jgi:uncharacterized membrane protein
MGSYFVSGIACALGFTLFGIAIEYFGNIGFLIMVAIVALGYYAFNSLPIDRWRWKYDQWKHR